MHFANSLFYSNKNSAHLICIWATIYVWNFSLKDRFCNNFGLKLRNSSRKKSLKFSRYSIQLEIFYRSNELRVLKSLERYEDKRQACLLNLELLKRILTGNYSHERQCRLAMRVYASLNGICFWSQKSGLVAFCDDEYVNHASPFQLPIRAASLYKHSRFVWCHHLSVHLRCVPFVRPSWSFPCYLSQYLDASLPLCHLQMLMSFTDFVSHLFWDKWSSVSIFWPL